MWQLLALLMILGVVESHGTKGPEVVKVDPDWSSQIILVTWKDNLNSTTQNSEKLLYDIEVFLTERNHVQHHETIELRKDQAGKVHLWNWTSPIPLQCTSHSVRIRAQHSSEWSSPKTISGNDTSSTRDGNVFPQDRVITPNSSMVFCCIVEEGYEFDKIQYEILGKNPIFINATQISNRAHVVNITEYNKEPSHSAGNNVVCYRKNTIKRKGATVFVGYPPDDRDLVCETDLVSVECHWNPGRATHLLGIHRTLYNLSGRNCEMTIHDMDEQKKKCVVAGYQDVKKWTLTASNKLGSVELIDTIHSMDHRLRLQAPKGVTTAGVRARNATVHWRWNVKKYENLTLVCQVRLNSTSHSNMVHQTGKGLSQVVLKDLQPDTAYFVEVRCGSAQNFWKWSSWSSVHSFSIKEDRPEALDIWIKMYSNHTGLIMWKPLSLTESHGRISGYEVTWGTSLEMWRESLRVPPNHHSVPFSLRNRSGHDTVVVKAFNSAGSSPPASITIPRFLSDNLGSVSKVSSTSGGFDLSWPPSTKASCGYIVDWCPTHSRHSCSVEWVKVPRNTNTTIQSGTFQEGVRYSFSIYACTPGAPELVGKREGYLKEFAPAEPVENLKAEQHGPQVLLQWAGIPLEKQRGFIRGYVVYINDSSNLISTENITDPDAKNHTVTNLPQSFYKFTVKAYTLGGEDTGTMVSIKLDPLTDWLMLATLVALAALTCILFIIIVLFYRNRKWVKEKVYPEIPEPKLPDEWLASHGFMGSRTLDMKPCPYSKFQVMEDPKDLEGDVNLVEEEGDGEKYHPMDTDTSGPLLIITYGQLSKDPPKIASPVSPTTSSHDTTSSSFGSMHTEVTYMAVQSPTPYLRLPFPQETLHPDLSRPEKIETSTEQPQGVLHLQTDSRGYQPQFTKPSLSPMDGADGVDSSLSSPTSVSSFTLLLRNPA